MLQTATYTDIGGRACNEDSVRQCTKGGDSLCMVVADGLGGHGGGDRASSEVVRTLCDGWNGRATVDSLTELIGKAHGNVKAMQRPGCQMKSTVAALVTSKDKAVLAHVGDSRIYRFYNGRLVFQTKDHSASQIAVMLGEITPDMIRFHEDRSRVLRAVGQDGDLNIEVDEMSLENGHNAFLLCSDGFWEYVTEDEMEADLNDSLDPFDWISKMRERLLSRIGSDNDNNTAAAVWLRK